MPLYQHRFIGILASGDQFSFSWWSNNSLTIDSSHGNAITWAETLWNGQDTLPGYATLCSADVSIQRITTGEISPLTGQQQTLRESNVDIAGTSTSNSLPADVAIVVSLRSPVANRTGRGRFYLPQPTTNALTAVGRLDETAQSTIVDALTAAWTQANAAGENPVIYSRTQRATREITSFNVGDLFDTQRRRENTLTENRVSAPMP
jgi:hypothetical protein